MPYPDWAGVTHDLTSALAGLGDGEFLILGEPFPVPELRRGLFGRRPRSAATRYVQALRIDDVFSAECVGATSLGGTWAMDETTVEQLRGMGWLTPEETRTAYGRSTPNFELYVECTATSGLADLLVASLAMLGARTRSLVLQSSEDGLRAVGC